MREQFVKADYLKAKTYELIQKSNLIIAEYQEQGYVLSIRQLYYQFVAKGWLPNVKGNYKKLIEAVKAGRLNGLIDWNAIEDRVRQVKSFPQYDSPAHMMQDIHNWYAEDMWHDQDNCILILSEKDAVSAIVERACAKYRVPTLACRGFTSLSELYSMGKHLAYMQDMLGKELHILHLGDHDPSGWDMTRDNEKRLRMFIGDESFELERIALNTDQVRFYNPPPAPANEKDARTPGYRAQFGNDVWELDALHPKVIEDLVSSRIEELCDMDKLNFNLAIEARNKAEIELVGSNYETARNLMLWNRYHA